MKNVLSRRGYEGKIAVAAMKTMGASLFVGCVLMICTVAAVRASDADKGKAAMILDGGHFGNVHFPHGTHQEVLRDCNICHHLFAQFSGSIVKMKTDGKIKNRQVMDECTACHFERMKKGEKTGPTSCSGCHND